MTCGTARNRFHNYLEGAIKGKDLQAFEQHVQGCDACSRDLAGLRRMDVLLRREIPKYWQSIQPTPDFLARLNRLELATASRRAPSLIEALSSLWLRHRQVLAIGAAICLVAALALTIPRIVFPSEEPSVVIKVLREPGHYEKQTVPATGEEKSAEALPPPTVGDGAAERVVLKEVPVEKVVEREIVKEVPVEKGLQKEIVKEVPVEKVLTAGAAEEAAAPTAEAPLKALPPSLAPRTPGIASLLQAEMVVGYTPEQGELAVSIALGDTRVQEAIGGKQYRVVLVSDSPWTQPDVKCTGPTVTIALEEAAPQAASLLVCTDLDTGQVNMVELHPGAEFPPQSGP